MGVAQSESALRHLRRARSKRVDFAYCVRGSGNRRHHSGRSPDHW